MKSLQKEKKPRSDARVEQFKNAREKRLESLKVKNELITEKKEEINQIKKLKPKDVLQPVAIKKHPVIKQSIPDEESEEEEIIVVKKSQHRQAVRTDSLRKKKPKKKVIYLDDSDSEEEEEVVIRKTHRSVPQKENTKVEIVQPVAPQYSLRFV